MYMPLVTIGVDRSAINTLIDLISNNLKFQACITSIQILFESIESNRVNTRITDFRNYVNALSDE